MCYEWVSVCATWLHVKKCHAKTSTSFFFNVPIVFASKLKTPQIHCLHGSIFYSDIWNVDFCCLVEANYSEWNINIDACREVHRRWERERRTWAKKKEKKLQNISDFCACLRIYCPTLHNVSHASTTLCEEIITRIIMIIKTTTTNKSWKKKKNASEKQHLNDGINQHTANKSNCLKKWMVRRWEAQIEKKKCNEEKWKQQKLFTWSNKR